MLRWPSVVPANYMHLAATSLKEVKSEVKEDNEILFFGVPKFLSKRSEGNLSFSPMS